MNQDKKIIPATKMLRAINSGLLDTELGEAISTAVAACLSHGKRATVTLKLTIDSQNIKDGTVRISHDIASKLPKEKREGSIVFATPEGNLTTEDPAQAKLDLQGTGESKVIKLTGTK
ncbi:hypothetical protein A7P96_00515 [Eikenella sp. NML03-A-027]|uniref:hypothetical protein n=1 Tax=Eikenella sp. NML03-A-027 TaxID=1795828 RepID=UPI0007E0BE05|nr:hypothetical protein [Eikenella sp. NML03-A-027]OAM33262.1 hypothetical protein A7P96_00515 [Eikenella sp. NML03-A-027]